MPFLVRPDGTRIFYKLVGRESKLAPLVFVHGWCSRHELWAEQARYFGKHRRVLLLDRRGHGRSTTSGDGQNPEGHAADIAAVVRAAGLSRVVAVGHAGGAAGTLEFLRAEPQLARAGVIVDAFLYAVPKKGAASHPLLSILRSMIEVLRGPRAPARKAFRGWYSSYFDAKCDRAAVRDIVAEAAQTSDAVKIAELEGLLIDVAAIADGVRQPMLWLSASAHDQAFIGRHLKNVGFAQVYGSAHFPQFEQPAQTNAAIDAFLARL